MAKLLKVRKKGAALLAVLWLSAALAAIAFSLATTVRGETERVATTEEDLRAYYLAQGAIDRATLYLQWTQGANGLPYTRLGQTHFEFDFPTGHVAVEVIPESSKININQASVEKLERLLLALGVAPGRAETIAQGIIDWRSPASEATQFDQLYLSRQPSFRSRHASFEEVEELLSVEGVTPDIFYGTWTRDTTSGPAPRLVAQPGLRDCVTVFGIGESYDANTVQPAVLVASGVSVNDASVLVARRKQEPFLTNEDLTQFAQGEPDLLSHLRLGGIRIYTLRATAKLRRPDGAASDLSRTVAATVKLMGQTDEVPVYVLRWYDRG